MLPPPSHEDILLPEWAVPLTQPCLTSNPKFGRYRSAFGGRGAGRTTTVARLLVLDSLAHPGAWYACCREFQSSMKESSKAAIENAIKDLGLEKHFKINKNEIYGKNGAYFFFKGIERNPNNIRGWERVKVCWVEEAEKLSHKTAKVLVPTIRAEGFVNQITGEITNATLWFTWNPEDRGSWVYQRFVVNPRPGDIICFACWNDNPWFPASLEEERVELEKEDPELYVHVWEGQAYDEGVEKRILPYGLVKECVDAWHYRPKRGAYGQIGFDVADTGLDKNAGVYRSGPSIYRAEQWRSRTVTKSALRIHGMAKEEGAVLISYDRQGVGAEARRTFADLERKGVRDYAVVPVQFGDEVAGKNRRFSFKATNEQHFLRRNAQMGWALRLRAQNTRRLLEGIKIDPGKCLFINPEIPKREQYLAQLAQPKWEFSERGRIRILKKEEDELSPDMFDATSLAFAEDSRYGLVSD